jgi:hypothetical protein
MPTANPSATKLPAKGTQATGKHAPRRPSNTDATSPTRRNYLLFSAAEEIADGILDGYRVALLPLVIAELKAKAEGATEPEFYALLDALDCFGRREVGHNLATQSLEYTRAALAEEVTGSLEYAEERATEEAA